MAVELEGCGVCASSLPLWQGRSWFDYPLAPGAPGHEGWGIVKHVDDEVDLPVPGDRVAMLSQHAFAQWDVVDAGSTIVLPDELEGEAFPGEALGCAMNIFRRSNIAAGQTVAIIGIGFLGALLTQLSVAAGATVIAISRREFALDVARQCGARETCTLDDAASSALHGQACDVVIEATGTQPALTLAGELVAVHGRLVIAGYHQDGLRDINMQSWNWKGIDVINAHERHLQVQMRGMREAVRAVLDGVVSITPLLTHRYALGDINSAFAHLERRPDEFLKAVVINS